MFKRLLLVFVSIIVIMGLAQARYVRKQVQPEFFMPESAKSQPERLPVPIYTSGQDETIKVVEPEWRKKAAPVEDMEEEPIIDEEPMESAPDYQQKYEDYNSDLEQIDATGQLPANQNLDDDLAQMNSDQRRIVEHRAYQPRNSKAKFDQALENSLNTDY